MITTIIEAFLKFSLSCLFTLLSISILFHFFGCLDKLALQFHQKDCRDCNCHTYFNLTKGEFQTLKESVFESRKHELELSLVNLQSAVKRKRHLLDKFDPKVYTLKDIDDEVRVFASFKHLSFLNSYYMQ